MSLLLRGVALTLTLATAACALPRSFDSDPTQPRALGDDLMQGQPIQSSVVQVPGRDQVVGCVSVAYDITPKGEAVDVRITESHPAGYFDAEVLNLMKELRFKPRKKAEHAARVFSFVPPGSQYSREAAASLCSPVPTHEELNR